MITFQIKTYLFIQKLKSMFDNVVILEIDSHRQQLIIYDTRSIECLTVNIDKPPPYNYSISYRVSRKEFIKKLQARHDYKINITFMKSYPIIFLTDENNKEVTFYLCTNEPSKIQLNINKLLQNFS